MTEHEEEFEDDLDGDDEQDVDLRAELDEIREMIQERDDVAEINRQIAAYQQEHGVRLSREQVQDVGRLLDDGYEPGEAFGSLDIRDHAFDETFERTVARVEREQGRSLLEAEKDKLWQGALDYDDPTHVVDEALVDTGTPRGRAGLIDAKIREAQGPPQPQGGTVDEDGVHHYDLDDEKQRYDYISARLAGHELADTTDIGDEPE